MKEAMRRSGSVVVSGREGSRRTKRERCSICTGRLRSGSVPLMEPEGVPEPRQSWVLCNECYQALLIEMRRSPIRTPLRLRIAMGLVATERWPQSYASSRFQLNDRKWIIIIAWGFVIAMIFHLALIVMIAAIAR
ncbi:MAG TPA: hypothetical protein VIY29_24480 [Ktedonobacteraceae bacterium]